MPPADSRKKLTPQQIELLTRWIAEGARWQEHWSYAKPVRHEPPAAEANQPTAAATTPIDLWIRTALASQKLSPASEADRVTLVRRLSFDLRGLPPTADEVDEFVNDRSAAAYENLVDRLLASPHYGERMATYWLDVVRFADTNGYHGDNHRDIALYRDYVIDAFNQNKPFDRFTVEQLAGDLLAEPDARDSAIASGYNHLLMTTREGGARPRNISPSTPPIASATPRVPGSAPRWAAASATITSSIPS